MKEVFSGGARGPFSKACVDRQPSVDRLLGIGRWRGIQRFPVQQRDRIRACDDACRSSHNKCNKHLGGASWPFL